MLMRRLAALALAGVLALVLLAGCGQKPAEQGSSSSQSAQAEAFYSFTDDSGREVSLESQLQRVVALMGSYAETWMLAGGVPVGVTEDVISERGLTVGEETKVIGTVKGPSTEEILNLDPDFILLSTDVAEHVELDGMLTQAGIPHAYFKVENFEDYLNMLKICTDLTGRADLYEENGIAVQAQIDAILEKVQENRPEEQPTVLFIRALSTTAKAKSDDNMTCRILKDLGTDNIAARHDSLLEELSMETILAEDPDYIFVTTMGNSQKAIDALKAGIQSNPAWGSLSAVQNGRYVVLPKELFHYKPNARWAESYEYLAKILYPDLFA